MQTKGDIRAKKKALLHIELHSGTSFDGYVFLSQGERLSDLINDGRNFIPFEDLNEGTLMLIAKDTIAIIVPKDSKAQRPAGRSMKSENPYRVLGVTRESSIEEIKNVYREKARDFHPDRFAPDKYPYEIIEFANEMMNRLNQSFQTISAEKESPLRQKAS